LCHTIITPPTSSIYHLRYIILAAGSFVQHTHNINCVNVFQIQRCTVDTQTPRLPCQIVSKIKIIHTHILSVRIKVPANKYSSVITSCSLVCTDVQHPYRQDELQALVTPELKHRMPEVLLNFGGSEGPWHRPNVRSVSRTAESHKLADTNCNCVQNFEHYHQ